MAPQDRSALKERGECLTKKELIVSTPASGTSQKGREAKSKAPTCFKCQGVGHFARDCNKEKRWTKMEKSRETAPLSARLSRAGCQMVEVNNSPSRSLTTACFTLFCRYSQRSRAENSPEASRRVSNEEYCEPILS